MSDSYKISLGIDFNDGELKNIKKQLTNLTDNTHRIRVDIDNSRLLKQIEHAKKELKGLGGTKSDAPALNVNTKSVETSLNRVADSIDEIRKSLNTLDGKSGMQSLVTSVNQIATALGKATDESETLVKSLNALSKKDFNINIGVSMGKSNPVKSQQDFGRKVRNEVLPELQKQVKSFEDYFAKQLKGQYRDGSSPLSPILTGSSVWQKHNTNVIDIRTKMADSSNLEEQIKAYQKYLSIIKEAAMLKGFSESDISSVTSQFSQSADKMVKDAQDIKTGAKEAKDGLEKLKGVFGASIDADSLSAQLTPITTGLTDIKEAIDKLSKVDSLNNLTQTFGRLSDVLDGLSNNLASVQKYFDSLGASNNSLNNLVDGTSQGLNNNANILEKFKSSLRNIGMGTDEIDAVANRIQNLGIQIETLDQKRIRAAAGRGKRKGQNILSVDISGTDKDGNVVKFTEQYNVANGRLVKSIEDVSTAQKKAGTQTNTFVKRQKNAVSDLTNTINQLNRSAIDPNAGKPIKDDTHLNSLSNQYRLITEAIERMGNASNDNDFQEERNNVKALISEYKSLTREYKNAETSATSFRSKDIDTIKSTNASDLDILIQKMKDAGVYTAGFEKGAENLRRVLNNATDTSGINEFLNGFDKLEAGYKRAAQYTKSSEKATTYGKRAQGLAESIKNIQRISPEINEFEVDINGAKVSVQSLLDALSQVKTKSDFDSANEDLKVFKKSAEAAGIATRETAKEVNANFNKLKSLAKEMGEIDIKLAKVDNIDDFNSLKRLANELEAEYRDLYNTVGKNLDANQTKELNKIFADTAGAVRELNSEIAKSSDASELTSGLERLKAIAKEINSLNVDIFKFKDVDNIEYASTRLNELENEATELKTALQQKFDITSFDEIDNIAKQGEEAIRKLIANIKEARVNLANDIEINLKSGGFKTQINSIEQDARKLSGTYKEVDGSIDKLNQSLSNMKTAAAKNDVDGLIKSYKEYQVTLKAVENQIDQNRIAEKNATDLTKLNQKKQNLSLEMKNWLKDNSAAAQDFGARIMELQARIDACDDTGLGNLRREFQNIKKEVQLAGKTVKTVGDRIKEQFAQYSTYLGVAEVFMWAEQGLRDMFEQVKLIDSAMTELKKVTNETDAAYDKFLTNAGSRAKDIGTTIDGLVSSTADFARLGYEFADAQGLAEVANIYAVVGDDIDSVETATQSLISTLTAFKDEAGDLSESDFALSIVDKMNEVKFDAS